MGLSCSHLQKHVEEDDDIVEDWNTEWVDDKTGLGHAQLADWYIEEEEETAEEKVQTCALVWTSIAVSSIRACIKVEMPS